MFDFSKLGDMAKLANEAKHLQAKQDKFQEQQMALLRQISEKLDVIVKILQSDK